MKFRNDVTKELYEAETDEVKAAVEEYRDDPVAALSDDEEGEGDNDSDIDEDEIRRVTEAKRTARSVFFVRFYPCFWLTNTSRAQKAAFNTMGMALAQVEREAGLLGVVILVGADPELGGSLRVAR